MRLLHLAIVSLVSLSVIGNGAEMGKYPRPDLLIEPADFARPEAARQFIVFDARDEEQYKKEHVPGARWIDREKWSKAFEEGKDRSGWGKRIGSLGIAPGAKVVVYDDTGMKDAARIWWILRYWGVRDVRLLNGGWKAWKAGGLPTTAEVPTVARAKFQAMPHAERLATKGQILDSLKDRSLQIVDARSEKEFCGVDQQKNKRAGAVPGAKNLEWSDLVDQKTHRFKSPNELNRLFKEAGIRLQRPTATYCQSGGRASVMAFGMELMGGKDVRNYYRSWGEWGNLEDTPIVVPDKKTK